MIKVWILIAMLSGDARGYGVNGPVIIDNIYNKSECDRLAEHLKLMPNQKNSTDIKCLEVWKAK